MTCLMVIKPSSVRIGITTVVLFVASTVMGITYVKYPTLPEPYYFSSTNCRAEMKATAAGGEMIGGAELLLNGEVAAAVGLPVNEATGGDPNTVVTCMPKITLRVMFDSTHFPSPGFIEMKMRTILYVFNPDYMFDPINEPMWLFSRIEDSKADCGVSFSAANKNTVTTTLFGPGSGYQNDDPPYPVNTFTSVLTTLSAQNYNNGVNLTGQWSATQCQENPGVIYFLATHGQNGEHQTGSNDMCNAASGGMLSTHLSKTQDRIGPGLPPRNVYMTAPTAHYLSYTCTEGSTNAYSSILWPYYNVYSPGQCEDQCNSGFVKYVRVDGAPEFVDKWVNLLLEGRSVYQVRAEIAALAAEDEEPFAHLISNTPSSGNDFYKFSAESLNIWGDQAQKIKGVYRGDAEAVPSINWRREI